MPHHLLYFSSFQRHYLSLAFLCATFPSHFSFHLFSPMSFLCFRLVCFPFHFHLFCSAFLLSNFNTLHLVSFSLHSLHLPSFHLFSPGSFLCFRLTCTASCFPWLTCGQVHLCGDPVYYFPAATCLASPVNWSVMQKFAYCCRISSSVLFACQWPSICVRLSLFRRYIFILVPAG